MGVDTTAYIINIDRKKLSNFLGNVFKNVKIEDTHNETYKVINFNDGKDNRSIHTHNIYVDIEKDKEYYISQGWNPNKGTESINRVKEGLPDGTEGLYLSFGMWGNSVDIMKMICYRFGGYIIYKDKEEL